MFQQGDTVIRTIVAMHTELFRNLHVLLTASHRELIHTLRVADADVRAIELGHIGREHTRRNPTLTEVKVKVVKLDTFRKGRFEGFQRLRDKRVLDIFLTILFSSLLLHLAPLLNALSLFNDVASDKAVFHLKPANQRIVVDTPLQALYQVRHVHTGK